MPSSVNEFSFSEPAELYGGKSWSGGPAALTYRRFDTAAAAIQFAVEKLSGAHRRACVLEVDERRFNYKEIQRLYDRTDYPLPRTAGKEENAT